MLVEKKDRIDAIKKFNLKFNLFYIKTFFCKYLFDIIITDNTDYNNSKYFNEIDLFKIHTHTENVKIFILKNVLFFFLSSSKFCFHSIIIQILFEYISLMSVVIGLRRNI